MTTKLWQPALTQTSFFFRLGMEASASECLVKFIDALAPLLASLRPDSVAAFNTVLNDLLAAQSRRDYLRAADIMEYEIQPFLRGLGVCLAPRCKRTSDKEKRVE